VISLNHYTRFIGRDSAMSEFMWLVADLSSTETGVGTRLFYIGFRVDKKMNRAGFVPIISIFPCQWHFSYPHTYYFTQLPPKLYKHNS